MKKSCSKSERELASHLFDEIKRIHANFYRDIGSDHTNRIAYEYTSKMRLFGKVVHCLADRSDLKDFG